MKRLPVFIVLGVCAATAQAELFSKPKVIAEYQSYSVEDDDVQQAGSFMLLGAGITLYSDTGTYADLEFVTGSGRNEMALSFGKSFSGYALFAGYKQVKSSEVEIPQHGDNEFDVEASGFFFGGSKNIPLSSATITLSAALGLGMSSKTEGDFYNDGSINVSEGDDASTWSFSGAYNMRLEDGQVMSLGLKYAEYDLNGDDGENGDASSFDDQLLSAYVKYAF